MLIFKMKKKKDRLSTMVRVWIRVWIRVWTRVRAHLMKIVESCVA